MKAEKQKKFTGQKCLDGLKLVRHLGNTFV